MATMEPARHDARDYPPMPNPDVGGLDMTKAFKVKLPDDLEAKLAVTFIGDYSSGGGVEVHKLLTGGYRWHQKYIFGESNTTYHWTLEPELEDDEESTEYVITAWNFSYGPGWTQIPLQVVSEWDKDTGGRFKFQFSGGEGGPTNGDAILKPHRI